MIILALLLGFIILILGADIFVEGAVGIAKIFKVSALFISLTLVALGTSAPEAVVSSIASVRGSDIALCNVIGSNIINIAVVAGVTAIFFPLVFAKGIKKQLAIMVILEFVLILLLYIGNGLSRIDGIILLIMLVWFIYNTIKEVKDNTNLLDEDKESLYHKILIKVLRKQNITNAVMTLIGITALIFGGQLVVNSAVSIARMLNMSEATIGLTIVAIGTSLPELATSIAAGIKKQHDIILGNIVGSNIQNVLFILGVASLINPIKFNVDLLFQAGVMLIYGLIFLILSLRDKITRFQGVLLFGIYIVILAITV